MSEKINASILLLTQNSEKSLLRCLDSIKDFKEIVLVDGGSTDSTLELASKYENVKIFSNPWPGFIAQRNYSIEQATLKWCFMIDSDEASTANLNSQIKKIVDQNSDEFAMYRVMRTEFFLGEAIESGFGRSNWQDRLFIKDRVRYTGGVHHKHLIDGAHQDQKQELIKNIAPENRVLHDETYGLKDWSSKLHRFATLRANEKYREDRKTSKTEVFISFVGTFFQILGQNRKQGKTAFIIAIQTAIFRCLVKLILYEREKIGFDEYKGIKHKNLDN